MDLRQSPLSLNPAVMHGLRADANAIPTRSPVTLPSPKLVAAPQPSQLLSTTKIQRIEVWRTEVGTSDITCVCSMRTSASLLALLASGPALTATKSPVVQPLSGLIPLVASISAQSQAQKSPSSSIFSTSDACPSTQATSAPSSNSLGMLPDEKLDLCPQCGVSRHEFPSQFEEHCEVVEGEICKGAGASNTKTQKPRLWQGLKKLARRYTRREKPQTTTAEAKAKEAGDTNLGPSVSRSLSRRGFHGLTSPPPVDDTLPHATPHKETFPLQQQRIGARNRISQTFKRMSIHPGSPLQSSPPQDFSSPSARPSTVAGKPLESVGGGTQMYSTLRYATADDERLLEILGPKKLAGTGIARKLREEDSSVDLDELDRKERETNEARGLRERAERLERGRRLLARNGAAGEKKRPVSYAGVSGIAWRF